MKKAKGKEGAVLLPSRSRLGRAWLALPSPTHPAQELQESVGEKQVLLCQEAVAPLLFQLSCALALGHEGLHLCVQPVHTLLGAGEEDSGWGPESF